MPFGAAGCGSLAHAAPSHPRRAPVVAAGGAVGGAGARGVRRRRRGRAGSRCAGSTVPVLPPGHRPLRVLHSQRPAPDARPGAASRSGCASLADLEPDLVVNTGDNLAHRDAVARGARRARRRCSTCPGVFVFGSNDYFAPIAAQPGALPAPRRRPAQHPHAASCPGGDLRDGFERRGWIDLTNRRDTPRPSRARPFAFAGVDDPHLEYDDLAAVAGPADADGRRADRRHARAVPPGARPVRRRRLRRGPRRPHPRRPAVPAGHGRPGHQLRPRHRPGQGPAPAPGRLRARATPGSSWLHVSAGLGHLAVRPGPVLLPPRGDAADAHPGRRPEPGFVAAPDAVGSE